MRAREPDHSAYVVREDGVRIHYETFGAAGPAIVFTPADVLVSGAMWKAQVPYLARRHRVVVIDPRGNGRSDRPTDPAAYADLQFDADLIAVLDELAIDRAVLVGLCTSAYYALLAAALHPERVDGVVAIATWAAEGTPRPDRGEGFLRALESWDQPYAGAQGWGRYNRDLWLRDWPRWPDFFFTEMVNDPHSTKVREDLIGWANQSSGAVQVAAAEASFSAETPEAVAELLGRIVCPVLVIHGTHDWCQIFARGAHVARLAGAELLALGGAGHVPPGRDPVAVNHAIADFVARVGAGTVRRRAPRSPARIRAHLNTRRDPAPDPDGRPVSGGTAYGQGPAAVLMLPARTRKAWAGQVPGLARRAPVVVLDPGADPRAVADALRPPDAAGPDALPVLLVRPGALGTAAPLLTEIGRFAAVVAIDAPRALAGQPGLLEFFVDRLATDGPAAVVLALVDRPRALADGRVPLVRVVDDAEGAPPAPAGVIVDALVTVEGGGPGRVVRRGRRRERRVLFLSSPIGLGHVRRDLAIAEALRRQVPGLRVDWLSQSPVTEFLAGRGERVHPASAHLAAESAHIESEAGEHDLHAFQAIRRMDAILVNNFHVFDDLAAERGYDAWVADEAWELDHFLHENPRLKRAPFVWLTDFVGWLPMPDGGAQEAALTADYNAEMVEHVARHPALRDRSIFVGDPEDLVHDSLGPGLPGVREWTVAHFAFSGYITGARPSEARDALRARLGYGPGETVCVASVGGSGVGGPLLSRVTQAYAAARALIPSLRMHVVTGPRIDPGSIPRQEGVTVSGFVPDLDLHHAACDIAVVQGGLSSTMELTAAGRPFLYFPLAHHFEQQRHVRHRLERHGAGRAMDYATAGPDAIAAALVAELRCPRGYVEVPSDGADRAAALVAEVL